MTRSTSAYASLIRFLSVLVLSLLVVMLGGLLKPKAEVQPVSFGPKTKVDLAVANGGVGTNTVSTLLNTTAIASNGVFCPKADFPTGSEPYAVAMGDFNGDGKLDLAVARLHGNTISILLGTGTGTFGQRTEFGTALYPVSLAVGDFNGDGKLDLAAACEGDNVVSILLGTGTGAFGTKTNFPTGNGPVTVVTGDFNGDGKLDLAVANGNNVATVSILLGTGTGTFAARTDFATGSVPAFLALGDFNGDGSLDLVTAGFSTNNVSVLLGTGTGSFGPSTDFGVGVFPQAVAVGDFNGDGKLDLVATNRMSDTVSILLGTGTGTFAPKIDSGTGKGPISIGVGDFNGDGKLDLAIANGEALGGSLSVLLGAGTGTFAPKTDYSTGDPAGSVAVGDLNGDGKVDLVATQGFVVSVLLNSCNNTQPSITASAISRNAGDPSSNSQIATVSDAEDASNTLAVAVNGHTSATANGVTVRLNPTAPNVSGQVFADVVAACNATTASFTLRVTDSGGMLTETTLTVTVSPDNQPPTITCPAPITHSTDPNVCTAVVTFAAPVTTDNCPCNSSGPVKPNTQGCSAVCSPASGSTFPKGVTTVTCTVSDASHNSANCAFAVTVNDTHPPVFPNGCPSAITLAAQASCPFTTSSIVNYTNPVATDNCAPPPAVTCNPASGSMFPVGKTMVTCTATDSSGNRATCTFPLNVYSFCLQADSSDSNVAFVNALTGDYLFCQNGVTIASGTGTLVAHGCNFQIDHTKGNRKVHIQGDTSANNGVGSGTAYIQKVGGDVVVQITDRNMSSNTCTCSPSLLPTPSK